MSQTAKNWQNAFSAFADRRALIMLFLGFSAGIPILLIFSSLSLWLGEAGISRSAVTMFSWAALGYSFKFVWAPLIDELPVVGLTKKLGKRRAWLLVSQLLIICAICIMAMANPAENTILLMGQFAIPIELWQMALGAVLLGFASATQDIVIDAYRIELAEREMQAVLSSTYNAGYRIGMIVAGAGALFIAAALGTSKGNYIYSAWQSTYFIMAAVMLIGVITTLVIREPDVARKARDYQKQDYLRLVLVFLVSVSSFVAMFIYLGIKLPLIAESWVQSKDPLLLFILEAIRFKLSIFTALLVGTILVKMNVVNKDMAVEIWVSPIQDFFKRYGLKLALVLLLMIGFYRVSDIVAGVISNVFYQDMNFTKEQIATAVKTYGVIFALIGGFLGGLLSQRFNIMKMMFLGAVLMGSTNLIFIGLVKSGSQNSDVQIRIGDQHYTAKTDEVGIWQIQVPRAVLQQNQTIETKVHLLDKPNDVITRQLPYLKQDPQNQTISTQMQLLPIGRDGILDADELKQQVVIEGQLFAEHLNEKDKPQLKLTLDQKEYAVKIENKSKLTAVIPAEDLKQSHSKMVVLNYTDAQGQTWQVQNQYQIQNHAPATKLEHVIEPLVLIDTQQENYTLKGKVIKEYSIFWLYLAIVLDNLASGFAGAIFIAFLSSLTNVSFTAVQYAIFSSLMTLTPKILGGYSGRIVDSIGYPNFFLMTALFSIPILVLVWWVGKLLARHQQGQS